MNIADQIQNLPPKMRRGSRLRCLLLTKGSSEDVAHQLSGLAAPFATIDARQDRWLPHGLGNPMEAKLGETPDFLEPINCEKLTNWWLAVRHHANTPNWDLASTATVDGRKGFVLIEAKAHDGELKPDGKPLRSMPSANSMKNHARITEAIEEANDALNRICPGWNLSVNSHYQLANRFTWSWKIASLGIPVVLIYLGFLDAYEMIDIGQPLADANAWERLIRDHCRDIVPDCVWNRPLLVDDVPFYACIRSLKQPIPDEVDTLNNKENATKTMQKLE